MSSSGRYAEGTSVSSEQSRAEIERILRRYGATGFMYGWQEDRAVLGFVARDRQVRFVLPMPNPRDRRFTHTEAKGLQRSDKAAADAYEQAVRQSWRALALVIKAKLEAVEAGIVDYETEFMPHFVLPDGRTVAEHVEPRIAYALSSGQVPDLLPLAIESGDVER